MIPFNEPSFDQLELDLLLQAARGGHSSGNGPFTHRAEGLLEEIQGSGRALLATSCTHALEMSARLLDLQPSDEVIVPSYTFVSTASAFMWNGARPVFADVSEKTLNIDLESVESLITERTRAICIVHYAGIGAEPEKFAEMSAKYGLTLIEDNAHGLGASYGSQKLGTFGSMSTLSFHETKNITCGEGGALTLNDPSLVERAEILREKGTNRANFLRGQVDKYTWVDNGSSWVMSDLLAALLVGQLERFHQINRSRLHLWHRYFESLSDWASDSNVALPFVPDRAEHVGHMFYLRLPNQEARDRFIQHMKQRGIFAVFHYQPLHTSPVGIALGQNIKSLPNSERAGQTLVRLPIFASLKDDKQTEIIEAVLKFRV